ncbi:AAA domain-containing protein [Actinoallomurus sp. NPDC052274]|uniref:DEAD/DEAH box helicase n=1 Tax=Actinoallomurus sp. NPDC052274 TaxID=3155420 RepID=UPI00341F0B67
MPGRSEFVWLIWPDAPENFVEPDPMWPEIQLARTPSGDVVVTVGTASRTVTPDTAADGERLMRTMANRARVAVLAVSKGVDAGGRRHVQLGVNLYAYEQADPMDPQTIGVGDRVMNDIGRMETAVADQPDRILRWLADRLLLPPPPGAGPEAPHRMVVSVGLSDIGEATGYRIHGRGLVVDVGIQDGRLVINRVLRPGNRDAKGPLRLTRCQVTFTDVSRAGELRAEMRHQLNRLVAGKGFLAMWQEYNRLETQFVRNRVREVGFARYASREPLAGDIYRFHLEESPYLEGQELSLAERARQAVTGRGDLELEAATELPAALTTAGQESDADGVGWALIGDVLGREAVSGQVIDADVSAGTIDLRLEALHGRRVSGIGADRSTEPPSRGFLYLSFRGDRRQMKRRKDAFDRIRAGGTRIPNLLALLEGTSTSADRPKKVKPMSEAARQCFKGGEPTPRQEDALRVALNTPDIALIQGPPGTGKTQVITALQTRLAEEGRGYAELRGSILLTSFQHAAVDELVERSLVFGVPASKMDRAGRGTTVQVDWWRQDTIDKLAAEVEGSALGHSLSLLRGVVARTAAYLLAPTAPDATARLLEEIENLVGDSLTVQLGDRLRQVRDTLEIASRPLPSHLDDNRELAVRALRGVRTLPQAFADDGPVTAAKALRRVRALLDATELAAPAGDLESGTEGQRSPAPTNEDLELLSRAASWDDDDTPEFLDALGDARDRLLERLRPPSGPAAPAGVDPDVEQLLAEIAEELEDRVRESGESGPELAMLDYLEALRGDPVAVDWTLRTYTASYATTCQQVASPGVARAKEETRVDDVVFDTVIVDEAARANPLDLMIPLIHAGKRIILVGDHNQLPHMLEPEVERQVEELTPDARGRLRESLFQRLFTGLGGPDAPVQRVVTLDAQFRMHPTLGSFVSRAFYDGALRSPRPDDEFAHALPGYEGVVAAWISVPNSRGPEFGGRSKRRPSEARVIAEQLEKLLPAAPDLTFGVISFYADQVEEIWRELARHRLVRHADRSYELSEELQYDADGRRLDRLHVGSVDAFQGKEFDVVFLSTTRSAPPAQTDPDPGSLAYDRWVRRRYGHLMLRNRLCVAMSRQKRLLVTVGDPAMFEGPAVPADAKPLADFLRLCRDGGEQGRVFPG